MYTILKLLPNFFFLHFNNVENLDLTVRGMLCMPHSKVKYNIQNPDLAVRGMLCMPNSKVKYKIQLKISTPTKHYQTLPNFPKHAIKLLDHNFFTIIFYYLINIFSCYILFLFHKLIIVFTFIL